MGLLNFNNEQKLIQKEVKKFAVAEIETHASDIDKECTFPKQIVKKLSELGLPGLIIPEKYGGSGLDTTSLCIAVEEISKVCASISTILVVNNSLFAFPIIKYGQENQKTFYLPKLAQEMVGAYVCDTTIDIADNKLETRTIDGNYSISGKREFALNGEIANFFLLPLPLPNGKALCIISKETRGITITRPTILGLKAAGIVGLEFKNITLNKDARLIDEDKGENVLKEIRSYTDIGLSAISLGIAEACFEASVKYAKERKQFGRAICEFPMVQEMLVDMNTKIASARLLVYDAAARCDNGEDFELAAKLARSFSSEAAVSIGTNAIQIHGGYGYIKDYPVERYLRDAKVLQVLEKTPFVLKSDIAKELLT